jgi:hypothetical protein
MTAMTRDVGDSSSGGFAKKSGPKKAAPKPEILGS